MDDCIFCKIVKGEIESKKVRESDNFIVIRDANPKVEGHSLVIPKEHFERLEEMPSSLYEEFMLDAKDAAVELINEVGAEDFNLIMNNGKQAGQVINHVHLHILPRKNGDGFSVGI